MEELTQLEIEEGDRLLNKYYKQTIFDPLCRSSNLSWDYIMPILKQIEENGNIVEVSMSLVVSCRICVMNGTNGKYFNIEHDNNEGLSPITPLFRAAVEYVKWRNSNIN